MSCNFEIAIEGVLVNEGGYSNRASDRGGETKYGISKRAYPNVDIANLTLDEAKAIYCKDYWRFGDLLYQAVANKLLDMAVNMGLGQAISLAQAACQEQGVSITRDKAWGPKTCAAINSVPENLMLNELRTEMAHFYSQIVANHPDQWVNLKGWLRRAAQ
jgi:lysozyme family protein